MLSERSENCEVCKRPAIAKGVQTNHKTRHTHDGASTKENSADLCTGCYQLLDRDRQQQDQNRRMMDRTDFFKVIRENIENDGYHITLVTGIDLPRFVYTIGCKEIFGAEIIFAGGEYYSQNNLSIVIDQVVGALKKAGDWKDLYIDIDSLGSFSLLEVEKSWSELIALGAYDFYNGCEIQFLQILPDKEHIAIDVPNMSQEFDVTSQQIWQWLVREWDYRIPRRSTAVTNLKVLYGEKATEVMRWEDDEWEIFAGAGPDVLKEEIRVVPLGVLLGSDNSLEHAVNLEVGKGLWRDSKDLIWHPWE